MGVRINDVQSSFSLSPLLSSSLQSAAATVAAAAVKHTQIYASGAYRNHEMKSIFGSVAFKSEMSSCRGLGFVVEDVGLAAVGLIIGVTFVLVLIVVVIILLVVGGGDVLGSARAAR
jgi:hypothetical protein